MSEFIIYPAIDMKGGKVVRLLKGDMAKATEYGDDPLAQAQQFYAAGAKWIHLVNLDGAVVGTSVKIIPLNQDYEVFKQLQNESIQQNVTANKYAIARINSWKRHNTQELTIQMGGGIRTEEDVYFWLNGFMGEASQIVDACTSDRIIIGTLAVEKPDLFNNLINQFPKRISLAIDTKNSQVMTRGWVKGTGMDWFDLLSSLPLRHNLASIIYTDINRDGTGAGVNIDETRRLKDCSDSSAHGSIPIIASGGVKTLDDIKKIKDAGFNGVIVGRALYEGSVKLEDALKLQEIK